MTVLYIFYIIFQSVGSVMLGPMKYLRVNQ